MILVGQYDSPYVRRVAVSLRLLGFDYRHDTRSVFGDFDNLRETNPLGRVPALLLDDGAVLVDSGAILDWLDQHVGLERALIPPAGEARRCALQRIALATGAIDKAGSAAYERLIRPAELRWPAWIERCRSQARGALAALEAMSWPEEQPLDQATITVACLLRYLAISDPQLAPPGRYPALDSLAARCESHPAFQATRPEDYSVPKA